MAPSMDQLNATEILRGVLVWLILTIFFGAIASWVWTIRRLVQGQPLLPDRPIVERRKPPWGLGTIFLMLVLFVVLGHFGFERYALLTRGEQPRRHVAAPTRVDSKKAHEPDRPKPAADRGGEKPRSPEGREPRESAAQASGRPVQDDAESQPWGLSLTELMFVQAVINVVLIVLLPCLARLTSGARLRDFGLSVRGWRRQAATGIVAVLFLMPIIYTVQAVCMRFLDLPDPEKRRHPVERMLQDDFSPGVAYLAFLTAVVLAPLFEELLFRGIIQSWLVKVFNQVPVRLRRFRRLVQGGPVKVIARGADGDQPFRAGPVVADPLVDPDLDRFPAVDGTEITCWDADDRPEKTLWEATSSAQDPVTQAQPAPRPINGPHHVAKTSHFFHRPDSPVYTGAAIVLTSLFFASLHAAQWPAPIPLFLLSLALGIVYQRTGSLLAPICMHALFNGFSTLMLFFATLNGQAPAKPNPPDKPVLERVVPAEQARSEVLNVEPTPR
jgi:membrane protease YdiL (CAAX protease family)